MATLLSYAIVEGKLMFGYITRDSSVVWIGDIEMFKTDFIAALTNYVTHQLEKGRNPMTEKFIENMCWKPKFPLTKIKNEIPSQTNRSLRRDIPSCH